MSLISAPMSPSGCHSHCYFEALTIRAPKGQPAFNEQHEDIGVDRQQRKEASFGGKEMNDATSFLRRLHCLPNLQRSNFWAAGHGFTVRKITARAVAFAVLLGGKGFPEMATSAPEGVSGAKTFSRAWMCGRTLGGSVTGSRGALAVWGEPYPLPHEHLLRRFLLPLPALLSLVSCPCFVAGPALPAAKSR
ncbi:uncharacterized protein RDI95_007865 [Morus bassanus]